MCFFMKSKGCLLKCQKKKKKNINAGDVVMGAVTEAAEVL